MLWSEYWTKMPLLSDYKVVELKTLAKLNGLHISGSKRVLVIRIHSHYRVLRSAVRCQARFRGNRVRMRKRCVNDTDFYTLENLHEIANSDFFGYTDEAGFAYGFSIQSLAILFSKTKTPTNPYTRAPFPERILKCIRMLIPTIPSDQYVHDIFVQRRTHTMDVRIRELFIEIDRLGNYTDAAWFSGLNQIRHVTFFIVLRELWDFRSGMSDAVKDAICPYFDPFQYGLGRMNIRHIDNHREYLLSADDCKMIGLTVMENLIYTGINDEYKNLITAHILSALTIVSVDARNMLPWLYEATLVSLER
jgi:hypothetical protein